MATNWIATYNRYCDFLSCERIKTKSQKLAKQLLKQELEYIVSINGENELYESEIYLLKLLNE